VSNKIVTERSSDVAFVCVSEGKQPETVIGYRRWLWPDVITSAIDEFHVPSNAG
jgi:hypothetical protein